MRLIARFLGFIFATAAIFFVVAACAAGLIIWNFEKDLPEYARERRLYLPGQAIPPLVKDAFISAEDKNFYHHAGVDPEGILRATLVLVQGEKHVQGASTITQQVAKNF